MAKKEDEDLYRSFFENFHGIAFRGELGFRPRFFQGSIESITGYAERDFTDGDLTWDKLIYPDDLPAVVETSERLHREAGYSVTREYRIICKDGSLRWVQDSVQNLCDEGGCPVGLQGVLIDITRRKKAELALRQVLETINKTPAVVFLWRNLPGWPVENVTENVERIFGYSAEEFLSGAISYEKVVHPEDLQRVAKEVSDYSGDIWRETFSHQPYRIVHKSGQVRWLDDRTHIRRDDAGRVTHFQGVVLDITDRKEAEDTVHQMETRMLEAQKLESLGVMAAGIAHEFNNLLTGVLGNADYLLTEQPPHQTIIECLEDIKTSAGRAAKLSGQILAYTGKGRFDFEAVDLNALVSEMAPLIHASAAISAELDLALDESLPRVRADETQLRQVIMNLLTNAWEALESKAGKVTVTTGILEAEAGSAQDVASQVPLKPGRYVFFAVADTGHGIDEDTMARIFDPFFSTKFLGRGLGLPAALGIVRGHGGTILVDSKPEIDTTFQVLLPALPGTEPRPREVQAEEPGLRKSPLVLLIDDEEVVRKTGARMLEALGFRALVARDGADGVRVFRERAEDIGLVLLDVAMPRMGGKEALQELKAIRPDIPVVMVSGYQEHQALTGFKEGDYEDFIEKPFSMELLEEVIRKTLGQSSEDEPCES